VEIRLTRVQQKILKGTRGISTRWRVSARACSWRAAGTSQSWTAAAAGTRCSPGATERARAGNARRLLRCGFLRQLHQAGRAGDRESDAAISALPKLRHENGDFVFFKAGWDGTAVKACRLPPYRFHPRPASAERGAPSTPRARPTSPIPSPRVRSTRRTPYGDWTPRATGAVGELGRPYRTVAPAIAYLKTSPQGRHSSPGLSGSGSSAPAVFDPVTRPPPAAVARRSTIWSVPILFSCFTLSFQMRAATKTQ
jgi:hypothetical protein